MNISRRYTGGVPRAGDVLADGPLVLAGVETVDASVPGTQAVGLNHSIYVEQTAIVHDMAARLDDSNGTIAEAPMETIKTAQGFYRRFR